MKLYAAVRVLRGVSLGAATGHPIAGAVLSESVSVLPLLANASATIGGVLAIAYSGDLAGHVLTLLERPWVPRLQLEFLLLLCFLVLVFHS